MLDAVNPQKTTSYKGQQKAEASNANIYAESEPFNTVCYTVES